MEVNVNNVDRALSSAYFTNTNRNIEKLYNSGTLSLHKKIFFQQYLKKTEFVKSDFKVGGYTPWKKRLLLDRMNLLGTLLNDYAGSSAGKESFKVPGEGYYNNMKNMMAQGMSSGKLNGDEAHYLKYFLLKTRLAHIHFRERGLTSFTRMLLHHRMKMFSDVYDAYMTGDFNPKASAKGT